MPVTEPPTDQPAGQLITDQAVLERIFRASYDRWVKDAKSRLGEKSNAAPRVVSKAFHLAWQDRKRFRSQDELDAFIGAQIHHGATREVSRSAGLHRMDNIGGASKAKHETHEMDVNEAWDRLSHTLQGGAPEAYRARASTARHEAADHMKALGKERNLTPVYIAAGVLLLVAIGLAAVMRRGGEDRAVTTALAASTARKVELGIGQQANVTLDDSTIVLLGPESQLTIPQKFGIGLRSVRIEGAANFDVKTLGTQLFEVRAGNTSITATGTKFTVHRYTRDDSVTIVNVKEGNVSLRFGENVRQVGPGMSMLVTESGEMRVPSAEQIQEAAAWVDGTVIIQGRTLRYVVPMLKRWFGLDIKVADNNLLERQVFLSAPSNSKLEAIKSVEKSAGVKFTYVGENMVFQDTTPSRPARKGR
jgi:transmembrane sensor